MKKLFIVTATTLLLLMGCGAKTSVSGAEEMPTFVMVENAMYYRVFYHRDTKVMYAVGEPSYAFTLLVDADGKPLLYEG